MSDLQQFDAVFFDETSEHLEDIESLLLEMDENDPQIDDLNAIFRSAHYSGLIISEGVLAS